MESYEELLHLARTLKEVTQRADTDEFRKPLEALQSAAQAVERAFSGSWLGYHSRVYYKDLKPPPSGAHFSQEWGLMDVYGSRPSPGDWREFQPEDVAARIQDLAGNPDLATAREVANRANEAFKSAKADFLSITEGELADGPDRFLERLKNEIEDLKPLSPNEVIERLCPKGVSVIRDWRAANQGSIPPPHIMPLAEVMSLLHIVGVCESAARIIIKAASHLERQGRRHKAAERVGTNVFIGHGRSLIWRELKDFVSERLGLPWDEFNRVPVAGVTNIARLSEMLDAAAVAFLVMTAEDEMADGVTQARMNVVHEAGLFQGRLGFTKAIVLVEEGCAEFSNIQGLGQLRFPKGNIAAIFEDVRRVLEREEVIETQG